MSPWNILYMYVHSLPNVVRVIMSRRVSNHIDFLMELVSALESFEGGTEKGPLVGLNASVLANLLRLFLIV